MKTKVKITIFALVAVIVMCFTALFAVNFKYVSAASTYSLGNVFTASGESAVIVDKIGEGDDAKYYPMLTFGSDKDNVSLRRNLAYNWYEQQTKTEGETETKTVVNGLFNMRIGFKHIEFKKFVVAFESQQANRTDEGKTVNYVIFFPDNDGVKVRISDSKDATLEDADATEGEKNTWLAYGDICIKFVEKVDGGYRVSVDDGGDNSVEGVFENVGGNYSKYSSSSTSPVYPLIFSAEFDEPAEGQESKVVQLLVYSLNNQKLEVTGATEEDDHYVNGNITDDTPAVLCLNKEITHLNVGGQVKFDYQVIDVLRSSPSSTVYYYALKYADTKNELDFNDYKGDLYTEVKDDLLLDSDKDIYLPVLPRDGGVAFGDDDSFKVDMAVKVCVKVTDTAQSTDTESYVLLDWYVDAGHKLNIKGYDFIAVGDDLQGVTYNYGDGWDALINEYQKKVDDAAKNLSAGSSSYLYLPSAKSLFKDNSSAYEDMKISIYYYGDSQSSNPSLATNNLSINVTKSGSYVFTLYATDSDGNDMYYLDSDGKPVKFSSGDVWSMYSDDEKHDLLPWFSFNVDYTGAQFKTKPEKQSTAYVGTNYTSASFEINGVSGSYETNYRLFLFDRAGYYKDYTVTFSYDEFIEKMDELFEGENTRKYFKEIKEVKESDENYEEFKDYGWSHSSTSFTPQEANAFYYIRAELTDTQYNTDPVTCSLAVVSSVEAKELKGDSEWLKNNLASVILLSVAGICLIALVLLFVIKPKSKEDIDVQYENEVDKKKKSK